MSNVARDLYETPMTRLFDLFNFQNESIKKDYQLKKDDKIEEIIEYLNTNKFDIDNVKKTSKKTVKNINEEFFCEYFDLHKIFTIKNSEFIEVSPLDLKIKSSDKDNVGELETDISYKDHRNVFKSITLSKNYTTNSIGIYAHEITHTQLEDSWRINIKNYFNREMLSIFLEKVIMYESKKDGLENIEDMRRVFLQHALYQYDENTWKTHKEYSNYLARSYIVSTFEANHLFYIYANSTRRVQLNILKTVNDIFKRENCVENLLKNRGVTYENSKTLKYIKK